MLSLFLLQGCFDTLGIYEFGEWVSIYGVPKPAFYRDPKTAKLYTYFLLYFPEGPGFYVLDVSEPTDVKLAGTEPTECLNHPVVIDSFLYLPCNDYLHVFSLTPNPGEPKLLRSVPWDSLALSRMEPQAYRQGRPWEYVPEEDMLYYNPPGWSILIPIDISRPAEPKPLKLKVIGEEYKGGYIDYPYVYSVAMYPADSITDTAVVRIFKLHRDTLEQIAETSNKRVYSPDFYYIVTQDSSRKFLVPLVTSWNDVLDVTDPYHPIWRQAEEHIHVDDWIITSDERRVYAISWWFRDHQFVIQANDSGPYGVCGDTLVHKGTMAWHEGLIYKIYADDDGGHLVILHYPGDPLPGSQTAPTDSSGIRVPTFQGGKFLKILSSKKGRFYLEFFSSTGALLDKRKAFLRQGENLLKFEGLGPSGVYFLRIEGKVFTVVWTGFLN